MQVLTWNLFHGRSLPAAGKPLLQEFATRLASWPWDVTLLQEVPPWWAQPLADAAAADHRTALTSRNSLPMFRRAVARRWPDLIKSNGGGANIVLSRIGIAEHRALTLRRWPERRVAQLVGLGNGVCVANFHASTTPSLARDEIARLHAVADTWAGTRPLILGGDLNLRDPQLPMELAARGTLDFVFVRDLQVAQETVFPDRRLRGDGRELHLSDHRAVLATLHTALPGAPEPQLD